MSDWQLELSPAVVREHQHWLERGRTGLGRLALLGCDLRGATTGGILSHARFVDCDFSQAQITLADLRQVELRGCRFNEANLRGSDLESARLEGCSFERARLAMVDLISAQIANCDFSQASLERSGWGEARVDDCNFQGALLLDSVFDGAHFQGCDFRRANLGWSQGPPLGTAYGARFSNCDFRQADLSHLRVKEAVFQNCRLEPEQIPALAEAQLLNPRLN